MTMRTAPALLIWVLVTTSCGGRTEPAVTPGELGQHGETEIAPQGEHGVPTAVAPSPVPEAIAGEPLNQGRVGPTPPVVLPADPGLAEARLPVPSLKRYARWGNTGTIRVDKGYLYYLAALNAERWLLVKSADGAKLHIYDAATRKQLFAWDVNGLARDEDHVVLPWEDSARPGVVFGKADGLWLYAAQTGEVLAHLAEFPVHRARWSVDGRILMTLELEEPQQTARLRFYERGADVTLIYAGELPRSPRVDTWALSADNRYLARHFLATDRVTVMDLHNGEVLLDVPAVQYTSSLEFSPNGRFLAMGGAGVKVVDLSEPARRAEFSHFDNNVADVEFSPSGDVIAAPAYDGKVRLLAYDPQRNRLELVRTFEHQRGTNVYVAEFLSGGSVLVTSSGDRTVRYWSGGTSALPLVTFGDGAPAAGDATTHATWKSPRQWLEWGNQQPAFAAPEAPRLAEGHHVPPQLSLTPSPVRLSPGAYACKITHLYRLRDCTVEVDDAGFTWLEFAKDNLLGVRGVLFEDGPVVRFEGYLTTDAGNLGCALCRQQPIHAVLRGAGGKWEGVMLYKGHYDPRVPLDPPPRDVKFEEAIDRLPFVLLKKN